MTRVRWYNRLAAWLYEHDPVHDFLMELATPVWQAEADADLDEMWEEEARTTAALAKSREDDREWGLPF